ncbi:endonuclease IV [Sutcliffiella cohnii]|uniref:Endonuclease IV n=1 Tax=Sutcliffiella cohnii TaxID=33932 RepID=A0A223KXV6_9BACI|nr:endonuclease IV [Sutcliffiella cohnii]
MRRGITLIFGCHVSIRNGYYAAAKTAKQYNASAFQFFPKNPRSLKIKKWDRNDTKLCKDFCTENGILSIAHSPYPTNLIPENEVMLKANVDSIINDLEIIEECGSIGLVVHFGVYKGNNVLHGYEKMIHTLNEVLSRWNGKSLLLIENNAGKGGGMGTTIEELVQIRNLVDYPEKIGFCLDSCHAFASGMWSGDNWEEVEIKGKELGYFQHVKAVHLNNSKYKTGSMKDRHANISNGQITIEQMKRFILSHSLKDLPMILETPSSEGITHKEEINYLIQQFN